MTDPRIQWNEKWVFACDCKNHDMANARVRGEDCSGICARTPDCTHFAWTKYEGGTCWMKYGPITKYLSVEINHIIVIH